MGRQRRESETARFAGFAPMDAGHAEFGEAPRGTGAGHRDQPEALGADLTERPAFGLGDAGADISTALGATAAAAEAKRGQGSGAHSSRSGDTASESTAIAGHAAFPPSDEPASGTEPPHAGTPPSAVLSWQVLPAFPWQEMQKPGMLTGQFAPVPFDVLTDAWPRTAIDHGQKSEVLMTTDATNAPSPSTDVAPPPSLTTIVSNGASGNRVDIVFLGDGYQSTEFTTYENHANELIDYLFVSGGNLTNPFGRYEKFFNIHLIYEASNESGADDPNAGIYVDTAYDATYAYNGGPQRLLYIDPAKGEAALTAALSGTDIDAEMRFVTVNSAQYGGGGGTFGVYSGGNTSALEVALHEIGHSFADLADEYGGGGAYTGGEPSEVNVSKDSTGAKWSQWLGYNDPVLGTVGAYEGGRYHDQDIYRPTANSKMRSLDRPFDVVSIEQFILKFYELVDPLDSWTPTGTGTLSGLDQLTVTAIDDDVIDIEWSLDGTVLGVGDVTTLDLTTLGMTPGTVHEISARAYDNTDAVRINLDQLQQTVTWSILAPVGENDPPVAIDDAYGFDADEVGGVYDPGNLLDNDVPGNVEVTHVNGTAIGAGAWLQLSAGWIYVNKDGRYDFNANGDFDHVPLGLTETVTFSYTIANAAGSDTGTVTITVSGLNETPVAVDDAFDFDADEGYGIYDSGNLLDNDLTFGGQITHVEGIAIGDGAWRQMDRGWIFVNKDGRYDFDADGDFGFLRTTHKIGVPVTYTVQNATGSDQANAVFNVWGTRTVANDGDDTFTGDAVEDILGGDGGNDVLNGLAGDDVLYGGSGNDDLSGGAGNDTLAGEAGADLLHGGAGEDTADYSASPEAVTVFLSGSPVVGGDAEGDQLFSIENLVGSGFDDILFGDGVSNTLDGGAGSDVLSGEGGSDVLYGGAGFDALSGVDDGAGVADTLFGGADADIAYYFTAGSSQVVDFTDRTDPSKNSGEHTLDTWDSIEGFYGANAHSNTIIGDGQDNLFLGGNQGDVLYGGDGSDIVTARGGDDLVYGGTGNDFLSGDAGDDTLFGGAGDDTFYVFGFSGIDRIKDYSESDDGFLFYGTGATQWSDLTFSASGNDVHITQDGAAFEIIVEGATLTDLDNGAGNFSFL